MALPFEGKSGIGLLQMNRFGITYPGQADRKLICDVEQPGTGVSGRSVLVGASLSLAEQLQVRTCLLVIDDVWDPSHLQPFLRGGMPSEPPPLIAPAHAPRAHCPSTGWQNSRDALLEPAKRRR
jgi:hypothetical protein